MSKSKKRETPTFDGSQYSDVEQTFKGADAATGGQDNGELAFEAIRSLLSRKVELHQACLLVTKWSIENGDFKDSDRDQAVSQLEDIYMLMSALSDDDLGVEESEERAA